MNEHKLSLTSAILINVNIMLGAGIFLNTDILAKSVGPLSGLTYILIGFIMLPLVISIAKLTQYYPNGGLYAFSKNEINTFTGFLSAWSYFIGKLASGALMTHFSLSLIQNLIPQLASINILLLDAFTITFFVILNTQNMQSGSRIQTLFTGLKLIPLIFAITTCIFLLNTENFIIASKNIINIPRVLPLLVYASMGFEAACLISNKIKNAQKNAPKAILISYAITIGIAALYQTLFYGSLGTTLALAKNYLHVFPNLLTKLLPSSPFFAHKIETILHLALASSALGGSYGIMFSNTWNLYTLAHHGHIYFSHIFTWINKHGIPIACVIAEGILFCGYLFVSRGSQIPLQQLSALGVTFAYTISVYAFLKAEKRRGKKRWIPLLGLANCSILLFTCLKGLMVSGFSSLIIFTLLIIFGSIMFLTKQKQIRTNEF